MTNFTVKEVSEQNQELLRQALEEAEAEMSRKFEVIREIHCIESLPRMKFKKFDDTDVSEGKLQYYAKKKSGFNVDQDFCTVLYLILRCCY